MNLHKNARLTPKGRETLVHRIIEERTPVKKAAQKAGVSVQTARKWLRRSRQEGSAGLQDRSSRPHRSPHRTDEKRRSEVCKMRRQRCTYREISHTLGISHSTVGRIAKQAELNRLPNLNPPPANRYVYPHPGDLLHLDIKKMVRFHQPGYRATGNPRQNSRGTGWEYVHVAIDDHSRVAFACIHRNETAASACKALHYFATLGVSFSRVMTDNGPCYVSESFTRLCQQRNLKHIRTRPYTPRTNGKAERFIQSALREWAYARSHESSAQRAAYLSRWLHQYNWHRPHTSLNDRPPMQSIPLPGNNVMNLHNSSVSIRCFVSAFIISQRVPKDAILRHPRIRCPMYFTCITGSPARWPYVSELMQTYV